MTFLLVDLRGQKHEVEVTVKMGLEAKNYETVSFWKYCKKNLLIKLIVLYF
jgi:hypothetical protein